MATEIQSAITPERVAAEAAVIDAQGRVMVGGELLDFGATGVLAALLAPREWEEIAAYVLAVVEREPVRSSPAYQAHRIVLGSFANDLRNYARMAGEPTGLVADLRAATSQAEERRIRERIADQQLALERHLDDVALQQQAQHRVADVVGPEPPLPDPLPDWWPLNEEPESIEPPVTPPQPIETRDDAWPL